MAQKMKKYENSLNRKLFQMILEFGVASTIGELILKKVYAATLSDNSCT